MFALKSTHDPISAQNGSAFTHTLHNSPRLGVRADQGPLRRDSVLVKLGLRYTNPVHFVFKEQLQAGFLKLRNDPGLNAPRQGPFQQPSRRQRTFHSILSKAHSRDLPSRHRGSPYTAKQVLGLEQSF